MGGCQHDGGLLILESMGGPVAVRPEAIIAVIPVTPEAMEHEGNRARIETETRRSVDPVAPEERNNEEWTRHLFGRGIRSNVILANGNAVYVTQDVETVVRMVREMPPKCEVADGGEG